MKFEKREITLNECDSLKDVYYFEKSLLSAYEKGAQNVQSKETLGTIKAFMSETQTEIEKIAELIKKSSKNDC